MRMDGEAERFVARPGSWQQAPRYRNRPRPASAPPDEALASAIVIAQAEHEFRISGEILAAQIRARDAAAAVTAAEREAEGEEVARESGRAVGPSVMPAEEEIPAPRPRERRRTK
jgi:hypothetical protein